MNLDKYKKDITIVKLGKSDKDFLRNKAIGYLNNSTIAFPIYIFFGTLVGIYHFEIWRGFFMSLMIYFLYETKNLLKILPVMLSFISSKKVVGIGRMTHKVDYNDNYFGRLVKVELDKSRSIYLNVNESHDDVLRKIKIGHVFYVEITKSSNIVLVIEGQRALNKETKKKK